MAHVKELDPYQLSDGNNARAVAAGLAEAPWYASPISREALSRLMQRRNGPGIRDTAIWFGLLIGSGAAGIYLWGSLWALVPFLIYAVIYGSSSDSRWHEASHGTAFRTDWMNNALYEIASFMVMRESTPWRWSHSRHHSDTLVVGRDPEIAAPRPPNLFRMFLAFFGLPQMAAYFPGLVRHALGRMAPGEKQYIPGSEWPAIFWKARLSLAIYLAVIAIAVWQRSFLPLMFVGIPNLLGTWLMPIYGYTQHAGLAENVLDHRKNCRTVKMNLVNRFLYWNMNYHIEHHMYPMVPYYHLPELHRALAPDMPPVYPGIMAAWREIIPALLRQTREPGYFVERPLPTPSPSRASTDVSSDKAKASKGSLGDGMDSPPQATALGDGWYRVAPEAALAKESVIRVDVGHRTFAISRDASGQIHGVDGICSHGNAHLAGGLVKGTQIECPKHNGRFDLATGAPARKPVCVPLTIHPVRVSDGEIQFKPLPRNQGTADAPRSWRLKVVSNRLLTPFIRELILEPPAGEPLPVYEPGQYLSFDIPPYEKLGPADSELGTFTETYRDMGLLAQTASHPIPASRNYSLASNPARDRHLRFTIRFAPAPKGTPFPCGAGSTWMHTRKPGDEVTARGPFGDFLIKDNPREMVYLGGGAGMAPLRSHLVNLLESRKSKRKISFWYGARSEAELIYTEDFKALAARHDNFSFHTALSERGRGDVRSTTRVQSADILSDAPIRPSVAGASAGSTSVILSERGRGDDRSTTRVRSADILSERGRGDDWQGPTGFIHEVLERTYLAHHPDPGSVDFYLCGPPPMMKAAKEMLAKHGVPDDHIAFDEF